MRDINLDDIIMDLFNPSNAETNLLPYDGEVHYFGTVLSSEKANLFYQRLMEKVAWENDVAFMFGKKIVTKRKVAWYGDKPFSYTYSNNTRLALPWNEDVFALKLLSEKHTAHAYNSCLLNLYHDGSEGMAWHSDGEKTLEENGAIASWSFGAERKFSFKHKESKLRKDLILSHGSLLVMKGETQKNWLHRLPPTKKIKRPRVNLTFRTIID